MNEDYFTAKFRLSEASLRSIQKDSWGICLACYSLALITSHHVTPRAIRQPGRNGRPFNVMLCQPCHVACHKAETNEGLALKHQTLADVIADVRKARGL